jgi:hypothetical protein
MKARNNSRFRYITIVVAAAATVIIIIITAAIVVVVVAVAVTIVVVAGVVYKPIPLRLSANNNIFLLLQ